MQVKSIGVLTSGGDAPGMNAAVRAVVRAAIRKGIEVYGIYRGYNGLINGDVKKMEMRTVSDIIQKGGTILYTARCAEFRTKEGVEKGKQTCLKYGMDGVVVIGGDGSFEGAAVLSKAGIPCIGIPGTIDNDISCSEYTIGYDTAMNTALSMIDKIRDTAQSHDRCSIVEVMGRNAGYIALNTGIACGASYIIVPEISYDINNIIEKIKVSKELGKQHFIILVAEGIGNIEDMSKIIEKSTGIETRATVLGHVQRGGSPTVRDRVIASQFGYRAVELLAEGIGNRVIGLKDNKTVDYDIKEGLAMKKEFDKEMFDISYNISF
ncbi:MAG: 6-phosphofructokinase [Oscillospiraceae bacterium]|nr:6-phosphofructokinase [Oscillospiraceae bacterium]